MRCTVCQREIVISSLTVEENALYERGVRRRNQRIRRAA